MITAIVASFAFGLVNARTAMAESRIVPLTAIAREHSTRAGSRKLIAELRESIRSDGSRVMSKRAFTQTKQDGLSSVVLSLADGTTVQSIPELKVKSTTFRDSNMRGAERGGQLDVSSGCLKTADGAPAPSGSTATFIRDDQQLGHRTKVISRGVPGQFTVLGHYAAGLGCYPISERREFFDASGNSVEMVERQVITLTAGEPSGGFDIPNDYEELPPSQLRLRIAGYLGMPDCPSCMKDSMARADQSYYRLRPPRK